MASEKEEVQDIQEKFGDKPVVAHLDELIKLIMTDLSHKNLFIYSPSITALFCKTLVGQPFHVLNRLYKNEVFITWLLKGFNFISSLLTNPDIFNIELQKKIRPLVDLFYYFNKIDFAIKVVLFRLEVIRQIAIRKHRSFEENYTFGNTITRETLSNSIKSAKAIVQESFDSYTGIAEEEPVSRIDQACIAAFLLSKIKKSDVLADLDKETSRAKDLFKYLDDLHAKYLSLDAIRKNCSSDDPDNSTRKKFLLSISEQVKYKIEMINNPPHLNPEQHNQAYVNFFGTFMQSGEIDLKAVFFGQYNPEYSKIFYKSMTDDGKIDLKNFFLTLFTDHTNRSPSFWDTTSNPDLKNLCARVSKKKQKHIDWGLILQQLLELSAQINKPKMNGSKPKYSQVREDSLCERTAFFAEILGITGALAVIPDLKDLKPPAAEMECSSGPSPFIRSSSAPSSFNK